MAETAQNTILIYGDDRTDIKLISYCCRQMGYEPLVEANTETAETHQGPGKIAMAFVDLGLGHINLNQKIKVIAIGDSGGGAAFKILHYKACCFLPKPLSFSAVMLGLQKGSGRYGDAHSHITSAINIANALNGFKHTLQQIFRDPKHHLSYADSVSSYCQIHCLAAKTHEEISDQDTDYEILSYFTDQGTRYCNRIKDCALHTFSTLLADKIPKLPGLSPLDLLEANFQDAKGGNLQNTIEEMAEAYDLFTSRLFDLKNNYCRNHCPKSRQGPDFEKGDRLHVSSTELLQGVSVFCQEQSCPLDSFFEVFTRKVI